MQSQGRDLTLRTTSSTIAMGAEQSQMAGYSTVDLDMTADERNQALSALIQKAEELMQGTRELWLGHQPFATGPQNKAETLWSICRQAGG